MAKNTSQTREVPRLPTLETYKIDASTVGEDARKLLQEYSKIPADQVNEHVENIRRKAFAIYPYPCIGMFRFLDLSLSTFPIYPDIIARLQAGNTTFLDLGCCFGQEIRKLVHDGAPASSLYGSDLRTEFVELGYELFGDKSNLTSTFISSDIFQDDSDLLKQLSGKIDIVYTGSFFHLFDLEEQKRVAQQVVKLVRPQPGSLIIGRQVGAAVAGVFAREGEDKGRFRHDDKSWKELWREVGEKTGTSWEVEAQLDKLWGRQEPPELAALFRDGQGDLRRIRFVVKRL